MMEEPTRDAPLDQTLASLAREYHAPGDVPVEAMWQAIQAGRRGTRVLTFRRLVRVALPIAAVLAVGILIGRMTLANSQRSTARGTDSAYLMARPQGDPAASPAPSGVAAVAPAVAVAARQDGGTGSSRPASRVSPFSTPEARPSTVFSVAAERHFAQAESFLTLFRASVQEGKSEQLAPATARELLLSNRLLMDSPAANDPKVKRLLGDIELVLAQIAQMPAEGREADAKIITDGLEAGGVLTRIRSEVTSGPVAAVPQGAL